MNGENTNIDEMMLALGRNARKAAVALAAAGSEAKKRALELMARRIEENSSAILEANAADMKNAAGAGLSAPMLERLKLDEKKVSGMAEGLRVVASQEDPVGKILSSTVRPNGIRIDKVSVPIGVVAIIYESRPNVTCDAAGICLAAGNSCILRGGSEALRSNLAIARVLRAAAAESGLPEDVVQVVPTSDRKAVNVMLKMTKFIDLVMPRGGEGLIRFVTENSSIPVIKHYKGVCHVFVEASADLEMAKKIVLNAKFQRPGVCNAMESLLLDRPVAAKFFGMLRDELLQREARVYGDAEACTLAPETVREMKDASEYSTEYLDKAFSLKIVDGVKEAVEHINTYSSGHSEAIVTRDAAAEKYFFDYVDSAALYCNASTRFTDGGEFGMGAEIGISTDKIHARGPMGANELTIYKYLVRGEGQVR